MFYVYVYSKLILYGQFYGVYESNVLVFLVYSSESTNSMSLFSWSILRSLRIQCSRYFGPFYGVYELNVLVFLVHSTESTTLMPHFLGPFYSLSLRTQCPHFLGPFYRVYDLNVLIFLVHSTESTNSMSSFSLSILRSLRT